MVFLERSAQITILPGAPVIREMGEMVINLGVANQLTSVGIKVLPPSTLSKRPCNRDMPQHWLQTSTHSWY